MIMKNVRILKDETMFYDLLDYDAEFEGDDPRGLADYPLGELTNEEYAWVEQMKAAYNEMQNFLGTKYREWSK
jgi:hypothetical protein